jgi:hypothetical protein
MTIILYLSLSQCPIGMLFHGETPQIRLILLLRERCLLCWERNHFNKGRGLNHPVRHPLRLLKTSHELRLSGAYPLSRIGVHHHTTRKMHEGIIYGHPSCLMSIMTIIIFKEVGKEICNICAPFWSSFSTLWLPFIIPFYQQIL